MAFSVLRPLLATVVLAVLMILSGPAFASDTADATSRATARDRMMQGDKAMVAQQYERALTHYQAAQSLVGVPTTYLAVGMAQYKLNQLVEAQSTLLKALRYGGEKPEPLAFQQARLKAAKLLRQLDSRIPKLTIRLAPTRRGILRIGGRARGRVTDGSTFRINPGHHRLRVDSPGFAPFEQKISLASGSRISVRVRQQRLPRPYRAPTAVWVAGAMSVAGGLMGAIAGAIAFSEAGQLQKECPGGTCDVASLSRYQRASILARVSNIGFIVAGSALTVGGGVLVAHRLEHPEQPAPSGASAFLRGSF